MAWDEIAAATLQGGTLDVLISAWTPLLVERVDDHDVPAQTQMGHLRLHREDDRTRAKGYYTDGALSLGADAQENRTELGDGGFTDWTAQVAQDAKELCLVTCLAVERLAELV